MSAGASRIPISTCSLRNDFGCVRKPVSRWKNSNPGVAAAHAAGAITLMVPDIVPPTEETRGRCVAVLPDLHAVVDLLQTRGRFAPRA